MYFPIPGCMNGVHLGCKFPVLLVVLPIITGVVFFGVPSQDNCELSFISFTFDDGYVSVYDVAYPILDQYGYTGTAFVITNFIGSPGHMSQEQLLALQSDGWEIGSHTNTHPDLTTLDTSNKTTEILGSKHTLSLKGFDIYSFASPYGKYDGETLNIIKWSGYNAHRKAVYLPDDYPWTLNDIRVIDPYQIEGMDVRAYTSVQKIKDEMLRAKEERKWLVLVFHRFNQDSEFSYTGSDFEEIVSYAHSLEYTGVTV